MLFEPVQGEQNHSKVCIAHHDVIVDRLKGRGMTKEERKGDDGGGKEGG